MMYLIHFYLSLRVFVCKLIRKENENIMYVCYVDVGMYDDEEEENGVNTFFHLWYTSTSTFTPLPLLYSLVCVRPYLV